MAVRMRKWPPSPPSSKFQVAVKPIKLEGLPPHDHIGGETTTSRKSVAVKIKWKGEPKFFPFQRKSAGRKQELSGRKILEKGQGTVGWDDQDRWFENTCRFSINNDQNFGAWEICFDVLLYGENTSPKGKTTSVGRASMNIAEIAWGTENSSVERKIPINLQIDGIVVEAILTVLLMFAEIREPLQAVATHQDISPNHSEAKNISGNDHSIKNAKARRRELSQEEVSLDGSDEPSTSENKDAAAATSVLTMSKSSIVPAAHSDRDKKDGWFSWRNMRFSFKRAKTKGDKLDEKRDDCYVANRIDPDPPSSVSASSMDSSNNQPDDPTNTSLGTSNQAESDIAIGSWEEKEIISRDGQTKLKVPVFFASFDQCSDKAAGESACTALVAVISHWLHSNPKATPDLSEFDNLIMQGSSEWRKLCEDTAYTNDFPNRHFDLETILRADIRPLSISHAKSFVGFFGAEKFESLKGAMSFDDIWNEIKSDYGTRIYIVSWNDHFFVLKAEANAYYVVDTLGGRLYEGCSHAYILRFDDSALMTKERDEAKTDQPNENSEDENGKDGKEEEMIICSGKECCGEFIKRFLAAIPLKELEEEEEKDSVSYFSLHHRLQIEFNYCLPYSNPSSLTSSPFSSNATCTSTSSPFRSEEMVPQL